MHTDNFCQSNRVGVVWMAGLGVVEGLVLVGGKGGGWSIGRWWQGA